MPAGAGSQPSWSWWPHPSARLLYGGGELRLGRRSSARLLGTASPVVLDLPYPPEPSQPNGGAALDAVRPSAVTDEGPVDSTSSGGPS